MAWFRRRNLSQEIPELKPYYSDVADQNVNRWLLLFSGVLLAVLIAAGIFFGSRSIYRHYHNKPAQTATTKTTSSSATSDKNKKTASTQGSDSSTSSSSASSSSSATTPAPATTPSTPAATPSTPATSTPAPATASTATVLPNNGPGDVIAMAVLSAIVAGSAHYLYIQRKVRS